MSSNRKFYIGELFEDKEDEEYLKNLIDAIIQAKSDAGELKARYLIYRESPDEEWEEYQAIDFATAEQGLKADNSLQLNEVKLGKTAIVNQIDSQYIYTDAMYLEHSDNPLTDLDVHNKYIEVILKDATEPTKNNYDLTEALWNILDNLDTRALQIDLDEVNKEINKIKDTLEQLLGDLTDSEGNILINADAVNGIVFQLITQELYDELPEEDKNNWRVFYIIVDEMPNADEYEAPLALSTAVGLEFQVGPDETGTLYLQYRNKGAGNWINLISIPEIESHLQQINWNTVSTALKQGYTDGNTPEFNNWDDYVYPFLTTALKSRIVFTVTFNGEEIDSEYNNIDLTDTLKNYFVSKEEFNKYKTSVTSSINNLNTQLSNLNNRLSNVEEDISQDITDSINSINSQIKNINTQLSSHSSSIKNNTNKINTLQNTVTNNNNYIMKQRNIMISDNENSFNAIQNHVDIIQGNYLYIKITDIYGNPVPNLQIKMNVQGMEYPHGQVTIEEEDGDIVHYGENKNPLPTNSKGVTKLRINLLPNYGIYNLIEVYEKTNLPGKTEVNMLVNQKVFHMTVKAK